MSASPSLETMIPPVAEGDEHYRRLFVAFGDGSRGGIVSRRCSPGGEAKMLGGRFGDKKLKNEKVLILKVSLCVLRVSA